MSGEIQPTTATRFLLGELPEDERERLERRVLEDGAAGEALAAAEDDLLDAYAAGELPRRQRLAFERRLRASATLRWRAAFARALARHAGAGAGADATERRAAPVVPGPGLRRGLATPLTGLAAAASLLLALACGWLLWRGSAMTEQLASLENRADALTAERDALAARGAELDRRLAGERAAAADIEAELKARDQRLAELQAELERRAAPAPAPVTASFVLSAALRSEFGSRRFELAPGVERVVLTLDIGTQEDYPSYLAVITGPTAREVWSQRGLSPAGGAAGTTVDLTLPAAVLADGHHEALLYGEPGAPGAEPELVGAFEFEPARR